MLCYEDEKYTYTNSTYSKLESTSHSVSESLKDRHPYRGEPEIFTSKVHSHQVASAFGARRIPKYAALLCVEGLSDEKRIESLVALHDSVYDQELKAVAIEEDVIKLCADLLTSDADGVREYAARNIASLVQITQGRTKVKQCNGMVKLTNLLTDPNVNVREAASFALLNVSASRDGARQLVESQEQVLLFLVAAMFDKVSINEASKPSTNVIYNVVSVISNLTSLLAGEAVKKALSAGCVKKMVELIKEDNPNKSVKLTVKVLNSLWNISIQEEGKKPVIDAGAVPLIVECLVEAQQNENEQVDAQIRRYGSGALLSLSVDEDCKVQLQTAIAVRTISELLYDSSDSTRQNSISLIHHVSEAPAGLRAFTKSIVKDSHLLVEVFAERAAAPLTDLLIDKDADFRACAAQSIQLLTSDRGKAPGDPLGAGQPVGAPDREGWSAGLCQCLHIIPRLIGVMTSDNNSPEAQKFAKSSLENLCKQSPRAQMELESAIEKGKGKGIIKKEDFPNLLFSQRQEKKL